MNKNPQKILKNAYRNASKEFKRDNGEFFLSEFHEEQKGWLFTIYEKAESQKAVVSVLATCLVKKIEDPNQDIRYHKTGLERGFSGRTYDTKFVTPFFKENFRRLSMKESGWLTRSLEQFHPFTLNFPGKIRNKKLKESFLKILNDVEEENADPEKYLVGLFILLIRFIETFPSKIICKISSKGTTIDLIINKLKEHFFHKYNVSGSSKLPVIAIYSIYEMLMEDVIRYRGKKLKILSSHISPDKRSGSIGDIELLDENNNYFEAVEIKHKIPIDQIIIRDSYEKFKVSPVSRFYLLTTSEPNIKSGEEENVLNEVRRIREVHGCEVIINGIIPSLKYYLRLLPEPNKFIEKYTSNLSVEFSKGTEIKRTHMAEWKRILKEAWNTGDN